MKSFPFSFLSFARFLNFFLFTFFTNFRLSSSSKSFSRKGTKISWDLNKLMQSVVIVVHAWAHTHTHSLSLSRSTTRTHTLSVALKQPALVLEPRFWVQTHPHTYRHYCTQKCILTYQKVAPNTSVHSYKIGSMARSIFYDEKEDKQIFTVFGN